ncbi:MFS transporter [uncultured Agrococcus sp.]|uniref:MFS transporter n=1 Tax=uncultured Agrococcus sp. TaxID=382258 RepID=UPI0026003C55|nr:MFS transporter [uncultured Agrococcus sp.]
MTNTGSRREEASRLDRRHLRRVLSSAAIGQFVEWYDFVIYAYSATVLATLFFPNEDRLASLLATFAVYAVGFVMRPVGAIVFGHLGDRIGRRNVLAAVILLMGAATFGIGILPTYDQIGITAAFLLVLCRLLQGMSAGAETTGANALVAEHSPKQRRGMYVAFTYAFANLPAVFASLLVLSLTSLMGDEIYNDWGWRIPFLLGGVIALVGLYIRRRVSESPEFEAQRKAAPEETKRSIPLFSAIRENFRAVVFAFVLAALSSLGFYTLTGYFTTYLQESVRVDPSVAFLSNAVALLLAFISMPIAGAVSDRIGRKPVLVTGALLSAVIAVPAYMLASNGTAPGAIAGQALLGISLAVFFGPFGVAFIELFPVKNRFSGAGFGYNIAYVLFGGTAPYVSTWLVGATDNLLAPAFYMVVIAGLVGIISFALPKPQVDEEAIPSVPEREHGPATE